MFRSALITLDSIQDERGRCGDGGSPQGEAPCAAVPSVDGKAPWNHGRGRRVRGGSNTRGQAHTGAEYRLRCHGNKERLPPTAPNQEPLPPPELQAWSTPRKHRHRERVRCRSNGLAGRKL